jgi:hypothetical protein
VTGKQVEVKRKLFSERSKAVSFLNLNGFDEEGKELKK